MVFQDELKPKDPVEEQRLNMLKNQAAVWQQSQQMQQQQGAMWGQWAAPGMPASKSVRKGPNEEGC